jgi:adenylate kinase family enzyme
MRSRAAPRSVNTSGTVRIYIVGGPGSGKTSLASALSRDLGVPLVQLDELWDRLFERDEAGGTTGAALAFREQLVADQLARPDWVIEGAEPPFLDEFAQACDLIVWCDVPFTVAALRMVRRHVLADLTGRNRYAGYRRLFRFLRSVRRRYGADTDVPDGTWTKWTRRGVATAAARHEPKVLRLTAGSATRNLASIRDRLRR